MPISAARMRLLSATLLILSVGRARGDDFAYAVTVSGRFGIIDLNTGVFSPLGNTGQRLAGLGMFGGKLYGAAYLGVSYGTANAQGTLYLIDQASGSLTAIGTS